MATQYFSLNSIKIPIIQRNLPWIIITLLPVGYLWPLNTTES